MSAYYFLFVFVVTLSWGACLSSNNIKQHRRMITAFYLIACGVVLTLFAGLRSPGVDNDYEIYSDRYQCLTNRTLDETDTNCQVETSFEVIVKTLNFFGLPVAVLIFLFALAAITLKLSVFYRLPDPAAAMLIYFPHWFFLHEMTQIRGGLAVALAMVGLWRYAQTEKRLTLIGWVLLAGTIHISALSFLVLAFLKRDRHPIRLGLVLVILSIGSSYVDLTAFQGELIAGLFLQDRYLAYIDKDYILESGGLDSRFGFFKLFALGTYVAGLWHYKKLYARHGTLFVLLMHCMLFAIVMFYALFSFPAIGQRASQMFNMMNVLLFPIVLSLNRSPLIRMAAVTAFSLASLIFFTEIGVILKPYA